MLVVRYLIWLWLFHLSGCIVCFFFKQKTAYEMRISDWSSDVCSSDLGTPSETLPKRVAFGPFGKYAPSPVMFHVQIAGCTGALDINGQIPQPFSIIASHRLRSPLHR